MAQTKKPVKELREAVYNYAGETSNQEAATILREEATCLEELERMAWEFFSFPSSLASVATHGTTKSENRRYNLLDDRPCEQLTRLTT